MNFEAGIFSNPYPVRPLASGGSEIRHSISYSASDSRKLIKLFEGCKQEFTETPSSLTDRSSRLLSAKAGKLNLRIIAREFARFAVVYSAHTGTKVNSLHVESAYALLNRQVEAIPYRVDRVVTAGMAGVVLACSGMRVHLVIDNELAMPLLKQTLLPVYEELGYSTQVIEAGADEAARALAYQCSITLVSARECAMDFLRDAVKWPQRSNTSMSKLDRITGSRARSRANLMRGLPCAVLLDTDSILVDNARTPLALTQDAHPMHEEDELKQALEMVGHLERGRHFVLIEEGAEVVLTPEGKQQLDVWAEQLGGGWGVPHVAEVMLAIAIVVTEIVKLETHYRIRRNGVEWLVEDALVPGLVFYSKPFLERVLEIKEQCGVGGQRELAARASYQQIFNRYVHLCGTCHSIDMIEKELKTIYGLDASSRWPKSKKVTYKERYFFVDNKLKLRCLKTWLGNAGDQGACLVLANDSDTLAVLAEALSDYSPELIQAGDPQNLDERLAPGTIVLGLSTLVEHKASMLRALNGPLEIAVIGRSPRRSEDLRNQSWIQDSVFRHSACALFLSAEDELFAEESAYGLKSVVRLFGASLGGYLLERKIYQIQASRARESFKVRQGLISHDTTMHSMLSFSGRGLYE